LEILSNWSSGDHRLPPSVSCINNAIGRKGEIKHQLLSTFVAGMLLSVHPDLIELASLLLGVGDLKAIQSG
jgi:hypothetical protein